MATRLTLIPGQKFENTRLTFIEEVGRVSFLRRRAKFKCDCGNIVERDVAHVRHLFITSCGCLKREMVTAKNTTHGNAARGSMAGSYRSWQAMKQRVKAHPNYKDREICAEWRHFVGFYKDMGARPDKHTLERVDNEKGYNPDNCIWATMAVQSRNRGNSVFVTLDGVTKNLFDWCTYLNIPYSRVKQRRQDGWSVEQALTQPIYTNKWGNRPHRNKFGRFSLEE